MSVPVAEQRRVCLKSDNRCAFEGCRRSLSVLEPGTGELVVLGEIAHIVAERPDGPRGNGLTPIKDRNSFANLMLLCQEHHQLIDSTPGAYSVERLQAMKAAHEVWVDEQLGEGVEDLGITAPTSTDTLYSTLLPVERMPRFVYGASTPARFQTDVTPGQTAGLVTPFILHGDRLWAFQDLRTPTGHSPPMSTRSRPSGSLLTSGSPTPTTNGSYSNF